MTTTILDKTKESNKPSALHLTVAVADTSYVLGTLSFNSLKEECSYHFTYPEDSSKTHLYCDTVKQTARLEHITWHKNVIHIKRGDDVAVERVDISSGPLFCSEPAITPIYVESLYFDSNMPCLKDARHFKSWKEAQSQEILNLKDSEGFSVVLMLVPAKMDTASILVGTQFLEVPKKMNFPPCIADLCDVNHRPGRIQLWGGWDALVVTSPLKCRILSPVPSALGSSYRLANYQNMPAALTDLLMQANNLTKGDFSGEKKDL